MTNKIVVLSTCGSEEEAEQLACRLIEAHLAACVNIIKQVRSVYRWQGKIEDSTECLLVIKTSRSRRLLINERREQFVRHLFTSRATSLKASMRSTFDLFACLSPSPILSNTRGSVRAV